MVSSLAVKPAVRRSRSSAAQARAAAGCAILLGAGCASPYEVPTEPHVDVPLPVSLGTGKPETLEVHVHRGQIIARAGASVAVEVSVRVQAPDAALAAQRAASVRALVEEIDGVRRLSMTHAEGAALESVDICCQLVLPEDVRLVVRTQMARVSVQGYAGDLDVRTEAGTVHCRSGPGGTARITTGSGRVRLLGGFRRASVETVTGGVDVTLPATDPPPALRLASQSGRLRVDMDAACCMELHFESDEGALQTEFPVQWHDRQRRGSRWYRHAHIGEPAGQRPVADVSVSTVSSHLEVRRLMRH